MSEEEEQIWLRGNTAAWKFIHAESLRHLASNGVDTEDGHALQENIEARNALRDLFEEFDLEDFSEDLHLGDLIDKVLFRQLQHRLGT